MADFIAGIPQHDNSLGSFLVENKAKDAFFDFYRIGACLSHELGQILPQYKMKLSVAESCTAGLVSTTLTQISGASQWFDGGVISYSNEVKNMLLGVDNAVLKQFGAVSMPTVCQMASGVAKACKTQVGISISGIAGPSGGTEEKPVGTVFIGLALPKNFKAIAQKIKRKPTNPLENAMKDTWLKTNQIMKHVYMKQESKSVQLGAYETKARHFLFDGDRENIRQSATLMALYFLYENLLH